MELTAALPQSNTSKPASVRSEELRPRGKRRRGKGRREGREKRMRELSARAPRICDRPRRARGADADGECLEAFRPSLRPSLSFSLARRTSFVGRAIFYSNAPQLTLAVGRIKNENEAALKRREPTISWAQKTTSIRETLSDKAGELWVRRAAASRACVCVSAEALIARGREAVCCGTDWN